MAFDFKKEFKEFYMPKNKPVIVNVPATNENIQRLFSSSIYKEWISLSANEVESCFAW